MSTELDQGKFQGMVLERLDALKEMGTEIKVCIKDHEVRLQKLESYQAQIKVVAALFGTVAGALVGVILKVFVK